MKVGAFGPSTYHPRGSTAQGDQRNQLRRPDPIPCGLDRSTNIFTGSDTMERESCVLKHER